MGGKKKTGKHKTSSGTRYIGRRSRAMMRLKTKIKRWKRYQEEIKKGRRKSKSARWNTAGLEKQLKVIGAL